VVYNPKFDDAVQPSPEKKPIGNTICATSQDSVIKLGESYCARSTCDDPDYWCDLGILTVDTFQSQVPSQSVQTP
jgi:hypothetical protein